MHLNIAINEEKKTLMPLYFNAFRNNTIHGKCHLKSATYNQF